MRKLIATMIFGLFLFLATPQTTAQTYDVLTVDIPFNFIAGHEQLRAGKYTITHFNRETDHFLLLRSADGLTAEVLHTHKARSAQSSGKAFLVFRRDGDQRFLSEMWWAGDATGHQLAKTDREAALERELRGGRKPKKVSIKAY